MKISFLECNDTEQIKIIYNKKHDKEIDYIRNLLRNYSHRIKGFDEDHQAYFIRVIDIYYIEIVDSKSFMNTRDHTYRSFWNFKDIAQRLVRHNFVMCSKSTMVNLEHVSKCVVYSECRRLLTLDNGEQLIVNRKFRDQFDERFLVLK